MSTDHRSLEFLIRHAKHDDLASSRHIQVLQVSQNISRDEPSPCLEMACRRLDKSCAHRSMRTYPLSLWFGTYMCVPLPKPPFRR